MRLDDLALTPGQRAQGQGRLVPIGDAWMLDPWLPELGPFSAPVSAVLTNVPADAVPGQWYVCEGVFQYAVVLDVDSMKPAPEAGRRRPAELGHDIEWLPDGAGYVGVESSAVVICTTAVPTAWLDNDMPDDVQVEPTLPPA